MGYRVVIGDDESIIRMDLCEMLEDAGHTVVGEAADGVEALDLVRKEKPDIVLLDIKMPRLDGIHAARMIGTKAWHRSCCSRHTASRISSTRPRTPGSSAIWSNRSAR